MQVVVLAVHLALVPSMYRPYRPYRLQSHFGRDFVLTADFEAFGLGKDVNTMLSGSAFSYS
jgi:hypothetical protein